MPSAPSSKSSSRPSNPPTSAPRSSGPSPRSVTAPSPAPTHTPGVNPRPSYGTPRSNPRPAVPGISQPTPSAGRNWTPRTNTPAPNPRAVAPTPVDTSTRGTRTRATSPVDGRYRPTTPGTSRPVAGKPIGGKPIGNAPSPRSDSGPRLSPRPSTRPGAPIVNDRYRTNTTPAVRSKPGVTNGRPGSPRPKVVAAPRPTPRAVSPRLSVPRSSVGSAGTSRWTRDVGARHGHGRGFGYGYRSDYRSCGYSSRWGLGTFWDPCLRYQPFAYRPSLWSLHCGGAFGWSASLWYPWYCQRTWLWRSAYSTCWWNTWSSPCQLSTSYWWYPSSVYCPTFLYVPSTVVVVDDDPVAAPAVVAAAAPAAEPAAAPEVTVPAPAASAPVELPAASAADFEATLARKYVDLGDFYFRANRFAEAADAYARARSYAPDDAAVHFVLADAAFANGDFHFAAFLIAEGIRLDPALATAETDKRATYGDAKAFDAQLAALDRHLADKPYDASAHLVRGYNLRFSGRTAEAVVAFRRVVEIAPENRAAREFLAALAPAADKVEAPAAPDAAPKR
jgi:cytochrome c-type biogenesis protein CcmH/NrfG